MKVQKEDGNNSLKFAIALVLSVDHTKLKTYKSHLFNVKRGIVDDWTLPVLAWMFETLLAKRYALAVKALCSVMDSNEEMQVVAFRGMLCDQLPTPLLRDPEGKVIEQSKGQKKRGRMLVAKTLVSILVDEGVFHIETRRNVTRTSSTPTYWLSFTQVNEQDNTKGIEDVPGRVYQKKLAGRHLSNSSKFTLKEYSSQPLMLHGCVNRALIERYHALKPDWNRTHDDKGRLLKWQGAFKRKYYSGLVDEIMGMKDKEYYLVHKFDHRLRVGPEAGRLDGINLHGKTFETALHCTAEGRVPKSSSEDYILQQLYTARHKRVSVKQAVKLLKPADFNPVTDAMLLKAKGHKQMANLLIAKKALESLDRLYSGEADNNLFGWDYTYMGGMVAGCLFKSRGFLKAGNLYGFKTVNDHHSNALKHLNAYGHSHGQKLDLTRDEAKAASQGINHGEHLSSYSRKLGELGLDIPEKDLRELMIDVYGDTFDNIEIIAEWGRQLACSDYTRMIWTMPDGEIATHQAYISGVVVENYVPSATAMKADGTHAHYQHQYQQVKLPYETDGDGKCLYPAVQRVGKKEFNTVRHLRGLYADIIHSFDAYVRRCVERAVWAAGYGILTKHDNFYVHANAYPIVMEASKKALSELFEGDYLNGVLKEIAKASPRDAVAPELVEGKAVNKIHESSVFLMP